MLAVTAMAENLIDQMFKVGAHFGSTPSKRHPSASRFILGVKNSLEIIDLNQTAKMLENAKSFVKSLGAKGGVILFVGTKNEAKKAVEEAAQKLAMPWVSERWLGGTLTNLEQMKRRTSRLKEIREKEKSGELAVYTKKERGRIAKEARDLSRFFEGVLEMGKLPEAIFVVDSSHERTAVREAKRLKIPIVSILNSDCDLAEIDYPIIANDRSRSSIAFLVAEVAGAYEEGKKEAELKKSAEKKNEEGIKNQSS